MLSKLNQLETLDLSNHYDLGNNVLSLLDGFASLKSLRLQDCGLKGTVNMLLNLIKSLFITSSLNNLID